MYPVVFWRDCTKRDRTITRLSILPALAPRQTLQGISGWL
ncbi:hypothetical protein EDWATA_01435 [Edwardsiella tarda ATCC 23685]|uniref:Uncharacterized protein n=1 Tax=Edwardsiella tarda ATCC 23685 TaxID=500638 RepID=D4F3X0_EDWTA|nr:hypothetical protein EDWATA_01435 [Edwardsiella tarda ATCC 23685]